MVFYLSLLMHLLMAGNVACGGPGGVDGVFVTSLRLSCDEGLGNQEADEAVISASPVGSGETAHG